MRRILASLGALAAAALLAFLPAAPAQATVCDAGCQFQGTTVSGEVFDFNFYTSGSTVLNTGLSGTVSGPIASGSITGLVNTINNGVGFRPADSMSGNYFTFCNCFDGTTFNGNGLLFAFDTGNYANLYINGTLGLFASLWHPDGNVTGPNFLPGSKFLTAEVTAVPLPSTLSLFGAGLIGLGLIGVMRRKKQRSTPFAAA